MSRSISVCLRAVVALVALFGTIVTSPAPVFAATGMLNMETSLHESPGPGAPVVALLPEGTVVSIDGPPVDGGTLARELVEELALLVAPHGEVARTAGELGDPILASPLREVRFLGVTLGGAQLLAASRERDLRLVARVTRRLAGRELVVQR